MPMMSFRSWQITILVFSLDIDSAGLPNARIAQNRRRTNRCAFQVVLFRMYLGRPITQARERKRLKKRANHQFPDNLSLLLILFMDLLLPPISCRSPSPLLLDFRSCPWLF